MRLYRSILWACTLAVGIWTPPSLAQELERVPLTDFRSFREGGEGWQLAGDAWSLWDSEALELARGDGVVASAAGAGAGPDLLTTWEHGDLVLELEYLSTRGSTSGIFLQGRYEVQIADSWGVAAPTFDDAAGIAPRMYKGRRIVEGHAPRMNAGKAPGLWQHLRIVFEAPRFDDAGRKIASARFIEVVHNGVTVQESVQVTGPTHGALFQDERSAGPLAIAYEGRDVAFRNIRYRHFEPVDPVKLSNVRYTLRRGEFGSLEEMDAAAVADEGPAFGYVWNLFGRTADRLGLTWRGTIHIPRTGDYTFAMRFNWIDEIPYDEDAVAGKGRLSIGDVLVVDHTGADSTAFGTIQLEEGEHPFSFSYFKNRRLWRPIVFFRVEGPGMPGQYLNAYRTLPEPETSYPTVPLEPGPAPYVLRSFGDYDSQRKTNVISVGDPSRVHYAIDADAGSLLAAWKGPFVDVGSMWTARGELQNAVPTGQRITLAHRPSVAVLSDHDAPWPTADEGGPLRFDGYSLDTAGYPVFRYVGAGFHVREDLRPQHDGRSLSRTMNFEGDVAGVWVRIADGQEIRERGGGIYSVDGRYFVELSGGVEARVRASGGGQELIAPVPVADRETSLSYSLIW